MTTKQRKQKNTTAGRVLRILGECALMVFVLVAFLCFFGAMCYRGIYGDTGFDSVLYTLFGGLGGMQPGLLWKFMAGAVLPSVLLTVAMGLLIHDPKRGKRMPKPKTLRIVSAVLSLGLIVHAAFNVGLVGYVWDQLHLSGLYETQYKDPNKVEITFPEEKRNLIYIYLESMETSFLSTADGGAMAVDLIPELHQLAKDNLNFSHNTNIGGMVEVPGATWTAGAMVAHSAGVPMVAPSDLEDTFNGYGKDGVFLPGLTTLYNILHDEGYYQALMVGSDANFGGRKTYFETHGVDKVYDLYTARVDGIIPGNYFVWWGMQDLHLYEYAKQELTEMAAMDQPFAFTMLTVDTHHVGGYKCSLCGSDYAENYDNVYACASKQILSFIQWIQAQDFYENTTIIITGDHFSMDSGYFKRVAGEGYVRHGYNCFINAAAEPAGSTENRVFTPLDMFPTTLAAMGCQIDEDQLGLGVNLFSGKPTLAEQMGYEAFCEELKQRSEYYENHFH